MLKDYISVLKHTIIYGLGKSSTQIAAFLLLPLYTRVLTPSDYGILSLIGFFTGIIGNIFGLGTSTSVFRFYQISDEPKKKNEACYSALLLVSLWSVLVLVSLYPFKNYLSIFLFGKADYSNYVFIGLFTTAFGSISQILLYLLRAEKKSGLFVVNNLFRMFLRVTLGITFVVILKRSSLGALEASLITSIIFALYLLVYRISKTKFEFNFQVLIKLLKYGFPLVVHGFGWMIMSASDKYFLNQYSTLEQVGIYSIGYTMGYSIMIITGAFNNAWPQMMFNYSQKEEAGTFYGNSFTYYVAILGIVWVGVTIFSEEIVMLLTPEKFWDAYRVIPLIMLAYIFHGALSITSSGIYARDKTYNDFILTPITTIVCLILNFIFIPKWGMIGAAWSALFSFSFQCFVYTMIAKKYIKINFQWGKLLKLAFLFKIILILSYFVRDFGFWMNIFIKLILFIAALFSLNSSLFFQKEINLILKKYKFNF